MGLVKLKMPEGRNYLTSDEIRAKSKISKATYKGDRKRLKVRPGLDLSELKDWVKTMKEFKRITK